MPFPKASLTNTANSLYMSNSLSELDRASRTEKVLFASSYEERSDLFRFHAFDTGYAAFVGEVLEVDRSDFLADSALRTIFQKPTKYRIEDPAN